MTPRLPLALAALCAATACTPSLDAVGRLAEPAPIPILLSAPSDTDPNRCWHKATALAAPKTGTGTGTGTKKSEPHQKIDLESPNFWFEIPCELRADTEFVATLQRALAARSLYGGPINGLYDDRTRAAVRAYQHPQGLESGVLSLPAARTLGLVAVLRS